MARENCPFGYRKRGDVSLHCQKVTGSMDYCGHQYFCHQTKRWEATKTAKECPLREAAAKSKE